MIWTKKGMRSRLMLAAASYSGNCQRKKRGGPLFVQFLLHQSNKESPYFFTLYFWNGVTISISISISMSMIEGGFDTLPRRRYNTAALMLSNVGGRRRNRPTKLWLQGRRHSASWASSNAKKSDESLLILLNFEIREHQRVHRRGPSRQHLSPGDRSTQRRSGPCILFLENSSIHPPWQPTSLAI